MQNIKKLILSSDRQEKLKTFYKEHVTHYKRDIYSEFGEDFVAAVILGFKKNGYYVDVGAFQPKQLSVTYYFYKKLGWKGLVIEPNPAAKDLFEKQRPRDQFLNKGVSQKEGALAYYEFNDPTLNSFAPEVREQNNSIFVRERTIPVEPLSALLASHVPKGTQIDLMNVDVEGLDLEVLKSNDWEAFTPRVLVVEDHTFNPEKPLESETVQFLKSKGFRLKANCFISLVFEHSS